MRSRTGALFASPTTRAVEQDSTGHTQALWCEYLSLATLRKEVEQVIVNKGVDAAAPQNLHAHSPTLYVAVAVTRRVAWLNSWPRRYWNLVLALRSLSVDTTFITKAASSASPSPSPASCNGNEQATGTEGQGRSDQRSTHRTKRRLALPQPARGASPDPLLSPTSARLARNHRPKPPTPDRTDDISAEQEAKSRQEERDELQQQASAAAQEAEAHRRAFVDLHSVRAIKTRPSLQAVRLTPPRTQIVAPLIEECMAARALESTGSLVDYTGSDGTQPARPNLPAATAGATDELATAVRQALQGARSLRQWADREAAVRRRLADEVQALKGNIRVLCRVRPPRAARSSHHGSAAPSGIAVAPVGSTSVCVGGLGMDAASARTYTFDRVFSSTSTQVRPQHRNCAPLFAKLTRCVVVVQQEVYAEVSPLVNSVMDGYNACIFAYGQTGAGKTFTMEGGAGSEAMGVNGRALRQLFSAIEQQQARASGQHMSFQASVTVGCFEVYNEAIVDLLRPTPARPQKPLPKVRWVVPCGDTPIGTHMTSCVLCLLRD